MKDCQKLYILFTGPWGSGKTTIIKALLPLFSERGYAVICGSTDQLNKSKKFSTRLKRCGYLTLCISSDKKTRKALMALLKFFSRLPFPGRRQLRHYWRITREYLKRTCAMKYLDHDILIWENIYHALPVLAIEQFTREETFDFLRNFLPDHNVLAVNLLIDAETGCSRILKEERGARPFMDGVATEDLERLYKRGLERFELLNQSLTMLKGLNNVQILNLDATKAPEFNAGLVYAASGDILRKRN